MLNVIDNPDVTDKVNSLAAQWLRERPRGVDVHQMIQTPAYRSIIALGHSAIRPLLLILLRKPDHWFPALNAITGENPVPSGAEGRINEMANAWIKWGRERGYVGELD
jgi:hypothetical protein